MLGANTVDVFINRKEIKTNETFEKMGMHSLRSCDGHSVIRLYCRQSRRCTERYEHRCRIGEWIAVI